MDGRWWRRRLAAFGGAWLLAAVFAGAAIERAYAQATPKPAPTAPKPSKFPLTEEEKRQQAHQETFKAFERLKGAYEGKCEVVEIYPQFLKISRARDEFDAAVKKEAETSAEVEKARAELREREADA